MKRIHYTRRILSAILTLALGCAGMSTMAKATNEGNTVNYTVRAILPDNQLDDQAQYFDLKVTPGQEQVLQVIVKNKGDEDIEVAVEANTAFSNSNGVIEFSATDARDSSMAVDFAEIVTPIEPVIAVPANSEVVAEFLVNVPDEPFEGIVYGGFMFTKLHQGENSDGGGGLGIRNVYRYVIGVRLRESEKAPEPVFELQGAEIGQTRSATLLIHLRNPQPIIARGMTLSASVYPQDSDEAVATFERDSIGMAPNSSMPYLIYFDNNVPLAAGMYRVMVELQFEDQAWQFETSLTVE